MELILTTTGTYINVKNGIFAVRSDNNTTTVSPAKIDRIIVTTEAVLTTAAIQLAVENNIDLIVLDKTGTPVGRFWHSRFGSITTIRRKQLLLNMNQNSTEITKNWIIQKLKNQVEFAKELAKNRDSLRDTIKQKYAVIENNIEKLCMVDGSVDDRRGTIIGLEGNATKAYFEILAICIPDKYKFKGRSRQPAKDPFNAFLNYTYGILYSEVEKACIIAGLDPYIGFLHTDNYNKQSLVFDIIENFRIYADRIVLRLFSKKMVSDKMIDSIPNGCSLNKEGKRLLFDEYSKFMQTVVRFGNRNIKQALTIQAFCHQFANSLLDDSSDEDFDEDVYDGDLS
jgi:CRISP-associated protein Cas1